MPYKYYICRVKYSKEDICNKLGLKDARSVSVVLTDEVLCQRILSEPICTLDSYVRETGYNRKSILSLVDNGLIGCFTTKGLGLNVREGLTVYLFKGELSKFEEMFELGYTTNEFLGCLQNVLHINNRIMGSVLNERDKMVYDLVVQYRSFRRICELTELSYSDVQHSWYRIKRSLGRNVSLYEYKDTLRSEIVRLRSEITVLEKYRATLPPLEDKELPSIEVLSKRVDSLDISVRLYNCLKSCEVYTLGDVANKGRRFFLKGRNFGAKTIGELEELMLRYGIKLKD